MSRRGWLLFAALCLIWGLPYLFIRVAVEQLDPATLVFLRTAGAAAILLPVALRRGLGRAILRRWRPVLLFAAVELMVPWLLLGDAERKVSSSLAGLLVATVPLISVLLTRLSGQANPMTGRRLVALLIGVAGVVCLVGLDLGRIDLTAVAELFLVGLGYAAGPLVLTRGLAGLPGVAVMAGAMTVTAAAYLPAVLVSPPTRLSAQTVASVVVLAVVCTALGFVVFFELISVIGPTRCTVVTYVNPAVAVLLGVAVLGERVTAGMLVGFPLILLGSIGAARRAPDAADPVAERPPAPVG